MSIHNGGVLYQVVMTHNCSVFRNACLKVPVDPFTKMPKTAYERKRKTVKEQSSIDSVSTTCSVSTADIDAEKLKDFYRSIPDYNDINHLPEEQFYSTLNSLREKKQIMLRVAVDHIDDCDKHGKPIESILVKTNIRDKDAKIRNKYSAENKDNSIEMPKSDLGKMTNDSTLSSTKVTGITLKKHSRKTAGFTDTNKYVENDFKLTPEITPPGRENIRPDRPKRIQSACSISWSDAKIEKTEVDHKFDEFFDGRKYTSTCKDHFKTQSMPSSPVRRQRSPIRRRKSITIPKPFKMTERWDNFRKSKQHKA